LKFRRNRAKEGASSTDKILLGKLGENLGEKLGEK